MSAISENTAAAIAAFDQGAEANLHTPARRGNLIALSPENADDVLVTADLHGQQEHLNAILRLAALDDHPRRHLILQEVCHGGATYPDGVACQSHLMLLRVARLKVQYPDRVHFLLSNHEWSELADYPIMKARRMLNLAFRLGLQEAYGDRAEEVRHSFLPFIHTCPLALRFDNVFISHSLPERVDSRGFDGQLFERHLAEEDWRAQGPVFQLVWGRDFRVENAAAFCKIVGAEILIHGHEPSANGYLLPNDHQVILDTCCPRPAVALLPIGRPLTHSQVVERIQFLQLAERA